MAFMVWNDKLTVNIESIDADHKRMVGMINELYDAIAAGYSSVMIGTILDGLVDYTRYHFAREEKYFAMTGYLDAEAHKKEHDELTARVMEIQEQRRNGTLAAPSLDVMVFLKDWLFEHIIGSDLKFGPHLIAMGVQ
jgi:hemerythrin